MLQLIHLCASVKHCFAVRVIPQNARNWFGLMLNNSLHFISFEKACKKYHCIYTELCELAAETMANSFCVSITPPKGFNMKYRILCKICPYVFQHLYLEILLIFSISFLISELFNSFVLLGYVMHYNK